MNVKDLRKALEGLDDNVVVVVGAPDHEYREAGSAWDEDTFQAIDEEGYPEPQYLEHGDEPYGPFTQPVKVLVISWVAPGILCLKKGR